MSSESKLPSEATYFLSQFEIALRKLPSEERSEIVSELRCHLLEKMDRGGSNEVLNSLAGFGGPQSCAAGFVENASIRSAIVSRSVGSMLAHNLKLAGRGTRYFLASVIVLLLFVFAFALGIISVLKPVFPSQIGLWTFEHSNSFIFGFASEASQMGGAEHLGYWIVPLGITLGIGLFTLANYAMRHTLGMWLDKHGLTSQSRRSTS